MYNKQYRLNQFLIDLAAFFEKYYSQGVTEIVVTEEDRSILITFSGDCHSRIELTSCGEEVIITFSESHWHIDNYNEPCDMNKIYWNAIHIIMDILDRKIGTYSFWNNDVYLGGASFELPIEEALLSARNTFKNTSEIHVKRWGSPTEIYKY
ncbi:MAG: hypothetical protein AAGA60_00645 [Cyanobacteria bacterium P01_E01_bin.42]